MAGSVPPPPAGDSPDLLGALQESLNRGVAPSPQAVERALKMQAGSVLAREVLRLREIEQRAKRMRSRPLDPSSESMGARACARFVLGESS